ncbi:unnamed protein product, partial [Staurois parvus]
MSATHQCCPAVPPTSAPQCPHQCHPSVPPIISAQQCCQLVPPISGAYQCLSVPIIVAYQCSIISAASSVRVPQCHLSVLPIHATSSVPISAAYQCPSALHINAAY